MSNTQLTVGKILKKELSDRFTRNPNYSLRAFARDLGISAPRLSRILNGDLNLSAEAATKIAGVLSLKGLEQSMFVSLAEASSARSKTKQVEAFKDFKKLYSQSQSTISMDTFNVISEWFHYGLMALIETKFFINDTEWMASQLGIKKIQVEEALERLLRLDMILKDEEGNLSVEQSFTLDSQLVSQKALRQYHEQLISKALNALMEQTVQERFVYSSVFAVDTNSLSDLKKYIEKLHHTSDATAAAHENKNAVYGLSTQLFKLSKYINQ